MYQPWHPLGHNLESWPGLDLSVESRSVKIVLTNWRGGVCFFGLEFSFRHSIAGLYIYDEGTACTDQPGMPAPEEFDTGEHKGYPAWIDHSGRRLAIYNDGQERYSHIDSYYFVGQSIVIVLDVADAQPAVLELDPNAINGA